MTADEPENPALLDLVRYLELGASESNSPTFRDQFRDRVQAVRAAVAELARVTAENRLLRAERDRLIESWPDRYGQTFAIEKTEDGYRVERLGGRAWETATFPTRAEAVRFAARLDGAED